MPIEEPIVESPKPDKMFAIAQRIASGEAGTLFTYCLEDDHFYMYQDGHWRIVFEIEALAIVCKSFKNLHKYPIGVKKQILEQLKLLVYKPLKEFNQSELINFPNGMFDCYGNNVLSHKPEFLSTIRIPYRYDKLAQCPLWLKTVGEIFEDDKGKISVLQEFFGYCLTRDTRQRKALLLLGESNCGKSSILSVLRKIIGDKNCSSVPLKYLANPQYAPLLINKLANIDADVSGGAEQFEAEFKMITSGEEINCNQKFVATFPFVPTCKIVMAANVFPRITDHSSAFYNRLILIPCDRIFQEEEQDKDLANKLTEELSGIFNWTLEGFQRLNKRGRFEIKNSFMTDAVSELREESNPVEVFFREHIKTDVSRDGIEAEKGDLYNKYVHWCRINGNAPMAANKFSSSVYRKYSKFTPKNIKNNDLQKRVWKNLVYIPSQQTNGTTVEGWQDK